MRVDTCNWSWHNNATLTLGLRKRHWPCFLKRQWELPTYICNPTETTKKSTKFLTIDQLQYHGRSLKENFRDHKTMVLSCVTWTSFFARPDQTSSDHTTPSIDTWIWYTREESVNFPLHLWIFFLVPSLNLSGILPQILPNPQRFSSGTSRHQGFRLTFYPRCSNEGRI